MLFFHTFHDRGLPLPFLGFMLSWYATNKCRCVGDLVFLMCSMFLMVFGRVVFSHQFCLLGIYLDGILVELSGVVLVDIGVFYLQVRFVMQMILFCWPHALRTMLDICTSYIMQSLVVWSLMQTKYSLYNYVFTCPPYALHTTYTATIF